MRPAPVIPIAKGLQAAFDLFDRGVELKRRALKRKFPKASRREIERKLDRWLGSKPPLEGPDFIKVPKSEWPEAWKTPPKPEKRVPRKR